MLSLVTAMALMLVVNETNYPSVGWALAHQFLAQGFEFGGLKPILRLRLSRICEDGSR